MHAPASILAALAAILRDTGARAETAALAAVKAGAAADALQDFDRIAQRCVGVAAVLEEAVRGAEADALIAAARIDDVRRPLAAALGVAIDAQDGPGDELF